jgi:hypothetical protein
MTAPDAGPQIEAVLDIIAPYIDGPPGFDPVRWPRLAWHDHGHAIVPSDKQIHDLARQVVNAVHAAVGSAS